jgi:propanol-preferring alcohol dehydrogenase
VNKVPIPTASGIYILVKIASASLCHSDLMPIEGNSPTESDANAKPVTIGHEGVGIIEAVGDKVKGFKVGDRVGFLATKNACCTYLSIPHYIINGRKNYILTAVAPSSP